jgi:hypothetical protein
MQFPMSLVAVNQWGELEIWAKQERSDGNPTLGEWLVQAKPEDFELFMDSLRGSPEASGREILGEL